MAISPFFDVPSLFYRWGLVVDRALKNNQKVRLPRPVISVGNLTVGGTGKTPLLIKLAKDLSNWGFSPAILSRGYRGLFQKPSSAVFVGNTILWPSSKTNNPAPLFSDEIALMAEQLPSVVLAAGPDRAANAARVLELKPETDVFVLDDGFQHWALDRDVDLVCVDATNPWSGGRLLPFGRLREPRSGLKRAQAVILTRTELVDREVLSRLVSEIEPQLSHGIVLSAQSRFSLFSVSQEREENLAELSGKNVLALSSIGNPAAFEANLERLGMMVHPCRFSDHHEYTEKDIAKIAARLANKKFPLLTTEKDWVKLKRTRWGRKEHQPDSFYILKMGISLLDDGEKKWRELLRPIKPPK